MSFGSNTSTVHAPNPVILNTSDVGTAQAGGTLDVTITIEERGSADSSNPDSCGNSGTALDIIAEQVDPYKQLTPDEEGVICLESGETRDVTFTVPVPEQPGEFYDFKISAYGDESGDFYASTDVLTMAIEQPDTPTNGNGGGIDQQTLLLAGGGVAALALLFIALRD